MTYYFECRCSPPRRHMTDRDPRALPPGTVLCCGVCGSSDRLVAVTHQSVTQHHELLVVPRPAAAARAPIASPLPSPATPATPAPPRATSSIRHSAPTPHPIVPPGPHVSMPAVPRRESPMKSAPARRMSSFEQTFGSETLRRTILALGERARLLTCASTPVCQALSPCRSDPRRLIDLVDVLVEGEAFAAASASRREEVLKTLSTFLAMLFGDADPGHPERWIEALHWTITTPAGCITRRDIREMLLQWKEDTPALTGRTLLERLATLRPHFRPKLLHFIAKKASPTDRPIVVTLHDLCRPSSAAWLAPVRAVLGLAGDTAAPGFGDLLLEVVRTATYEPPPREPVVLDTLNEASLRLFRLVRHMKDGATVPSASVSVSSTAGRLTATQCCQLLALVPMTVCGGKGTHKLGVPDRISTLFRFINDGVKFGVTWENVLITLANFIRAERIEYHLKSVKTPPIEGPAEHEVTFDSGDDCIQLIATRHRVTFFAEGHTYACADLRDGVVDRAEQVTFWPVEFTPADVAAAAGRLLQHARVRQLATDTVSGPPYQSAVIDGFEVGVERRGSLTMADGRTCWRVYLTHLSPSPGTNIRAAELKVVRLLLLRYPDA